MLANGKGYAEFHCRYHVQFKARHGSHWYPSYKASDLKPYLRVASAWIRRHRKELVVSIALDHLRALLESSGRVEPAQNLKRVSAKLRARIAFARLREAGVKPQRLLAIHIAVRALMEDDAGSHRTDEFRIVQVAKAAHRLASGTHRRWDYPLPDGTTTKIRMDVYPRSSGLVLRVIGDAIDIRCAVATVKAMDAVRVEKLERFGQHPSRLPGWRPLWARQREAASR